MSARSKKFAAAAKAAGSIAGSVLVALAAQRCKSCGQIAEGRCVPAAPQPLIAPFPTTSKWYVEVSKCCGSALGETYLLKDMHGDFVRTQYAYYGQ